MSTKKHFVLVHGAGHGAWCWYKVLSRLEQLGHTVTCLDQTGCGRDLTDPRHISSFDEYHKPLHDFISALSHDQKVVLVGHSAGGLNVTSVIHELGDMVDTAVYLTANMLRNGFCTAEDLHVALPDLSELGDQKIETPDGVLKPEFQRMLLYNLSPPEDVALSSLLLRPAPPVFVKAQFREGDGVDKVRRVFIKCLHDNMLKLWQQEKMIELWPPSQVFTLDSDHSAFFTVPDQLCDILLNV